MTNNFKLKIDFFKANGGTLSSVTFPTQTNNMTGDNIPQILKATGKEIFELSARDVKNGIPLVNANSYNGVVFDGSSDSEGNCDVTLNLVGENILALVIHFDNVVNEHAAKIEVNGKIFINNRTSFAVVGIEASEITLRILQWSKPNHHVKITGISLEYSEEFGKEYIKSLERNISLTEDNKTPDYGVSAQSGKLVMQDRDRVLLHLAQNNVLKDGLEFQLALNGKTIGKYLSSNLKYSSTDDVASIDLVDSIVNLQKEIFIGIDFPIIPSEVVPLTALEVLTAFYPLKFTMTKSTEDYLNSIVFAYPKMEQKDKYNSLIDFARATATRIFKNEKGELEIVKYE